MAGHSKWANIRHRKGLQDTRRGKIFTKIQREITVAVKTGGGPNHESNPRLRTALQNARRVNMPGDNIKKAVKKASGTDSANLIEVTFEGRGPNGVAVFVECTTDNKTRTVSKIRYYFNKYGGALGQDGQFQFLFEQKAVFVIPSEGLSEEKIILDFIDFGAEEVELEENSFHIIASREKFGPIQRELEKRKLEVTTAELQRIPNSYKSLEQDKFKLFMKLIDSLEDDDDVQKVYHNLKFDNTLAASFTS